MKAKRNAFSRSKYTNNNWLTKYKLFKVAATLLGYKQSATFDLNMRWFKVKNDKFIEIVIKPF